MQQSCEPDEIKDSCPFYDDLDEILGASAYANLTDVVKGRNVDHMSLDIHTHPCVYTANQYKMIIPKLRFIRDESI